MVTTVSVAARPGVFSGFLVSSFMVRVTSQPQKMKIESERPADDRREATRPRTG